MTYCALHFIWYIIAYCAITCANAASSASGLPIFQAPQFKLADMATELAAARLLVRRAAASLDAGHPEATLRCAMAKRLATDTGFHVCNEALQLHGGYGYLKDFPIERYLRDVRVTRSSKAPTKSSASSPAACGGSRLNSIRLGFRL
jgi:alkylation response protein AidB-like acyl-CoA dehydrogenase